jgi:processive 1,2-diacylglycerol beta-glucosyltransferase
VLERLTANQFVNTLISKAVGMRLTGPASQFIREFNPQIIISTYLITSALLRDFKQHYPEYFTVSVAADLVNFPAMYADPYADLNVGATAESVQRYIDLGVDPSRIAAPFFPINPNKGKFRHEDIVRQELGFSKDKPIVLITSGGLGIARILPQIRQLANEPDLQLIVIGGKEAELVAQLQAEYTDNPQVQVFGYVTNLGDYYNLCDVAFGKPGPATLVEMEAFRIPRVIISGRVGIQEEGNIAYALQNPRFKYLGDDLEQLLPTLRAMLSQEAIPEFEPRIGFDSALNMVSEIVRRYHASIEV